VDSKTSALTVLVLMASYASAQDSLNIFLAMVEAHIGLVLLIASITIILLMILILFYLQSISEHLNWIRRMR
jgi:hypothetical protein